MLLEEPAHVPADERSAPHHSEPVLVAQVRMVQRPASQPLLESRQAPLREGLVVEPLGDTSARIVAAQPSFSARSPSSVSSCRSKHA